MLGPKIQDEIDSDEWIGSGAWVDVDSSNVHGIKYDKKSRTLFVQFNDLSIYKYANVPIATAKGLFEAPSVGSAHWTLIRRPGYRYEKIL